jgi:hypothetical protein
MAMFELLFALFALGPTLSVQDTVIPVGAGDRLFLGELSGNLVIEAWDRDEIRAEAEDEEALLFLVSRAGSRIELGARDRKERRRSEDLRLWVPSWMDLEVSGRELDVSVRGLDGRVTVRTLEGDVTLEGLRGRVEVSVVEGEIVARRLLGSARLKTGEDEITLSECSAEISLETISGDVEIRGSGSPSVEIRTTDGDVDFTGRLVPGGSYEFHSHGGDLTLTLERPVDADVTVLVYEGDFRSDFPVRTRGFRSGQDMRFTIGEGGARVLLNAFDGEVVLRRAGGGAEGPDASSRERASPHEAGRR